MTDTPHGHAPRPETVSTVLDAKGLRAMAHPVRVQLIALLRRHGPSTATRLAERLGVNSGTASYHLRQLGAAGFAEEDTERGNARERWWRSVHQMHAFDEVELTEQEPEAVLTYLHSIASTYAERTRQAVNEFATMPRPWQQAFDLSDWQLWLTPDEASALNTELAALLDRYRRAASETVDAPDGAARVGVYLHVLPDVDDHRAAPPADTGDDARPQSR